MRNKPIMFIVSAVGLVVLGAATSIGVAVAAAWLGAFGGVSSKTVGGEFTRIVGRWHTGYAGEFRQLDGPLSPRQARGLAEAQVFPEDGRRYDVNFLTLPVAWWQHDDWGWPRRCLWSWELREWHPSNRARTRSGIQLSRQTNGVPDSIPVAVLPAGLAVNTAFYAGIWLVVLRGPRVVRWGLRRRRGACTACGYDRRGLAVGAVCPECGRACAAG